MTFKSKKHEDLWNEIKTKYPGYNDDSLEKWHFSDIVDKYGNIRNTADQILKERGEWNG